MTILEKITADALKGIPCSVEDALAIAENFPLEEICSSAERVRVANLGNRLDTCSIVNARSGKCTENCKWCAQSRFFDTGCSEYDAMPEEDIVARGVERDRRGVRRYSLVTSGRKVSRKDIGYFAGVYRKLRETTNLSLCASMGLLDKESLQILRDAGVTRYHCNLETSSEYFPELCTTHTQEDKLKTIRAAREVGMEVCSGGIIGMGESMRDRLMLAAEVRDAGACSIPVNILNPIKGTPLQDTPLISEDDVVLTIALMRLVAPKVGIRFAGGRARMSEKSTKKIIHGGLDGCMIGDLLTTAGNEEDADKALFTGEGFIW